MKGNNPVDVMDSVDAMDLLNSSVEILRPMANKTRHFGYLQRAEEQARRHEKALTEANVIQNDWSKEDSDLGPEPVAEPPKKKLTKKTSKVKVRPRRKK